VGDGRVLPGIAIDKLTGDEGLMVDDRVGLEETIL